MNKHPVLTGKENKTNKESLLSFSIPFLPDLQDGKRGEPI
jgi:hypothetical protein